MVKRSSFAQKLFMGLVSILRELTFFYKNIKHFSYKSYFHCTEAVAYNNNNFFLCNFLTMDSALKYPCINVDDLVQQVIFGTFCFIYNIHYTRKQQLCLSHKYYFFHFTDTNFAWQQGDFISKVFLLLLLLLYLYFS